MTYFTILKKAFFNVFLIVFDVLAVLMSILMMKYDFVSECPRKRVYEHVRKLSLVVGHVFEAEINNFFSHRKSHRKSKSETKK